MEYGLWESEGGVAQLLHGLAKINPASARSKIEKAKRLCDVEPSASGLFTATRSSICNRSAESPTAKLIAAGSPE